MRLKRNMLCSKPAKLLVFHLLLCFYFMHLGAIYFLCASAQFYAKAIFVIGRLLTDRGGVEVTEQTASLLAKAAPSLQHHSSIGS